MAAFKSLLDENIAGAIETLALGFEPIAEGGNFSIVLADDMVALLDGLQETVQAAARDHALALAAHVYAALSGLSGATLEDGVPVELGVGNGGVLDESLAVMDKALAKAYRKLDKRLDKTEALVAQHSTFTLQFSIKAPRVLAVAASPSNSDALLHEQSIDFLVSTSDPAEGNDGHLWVGGTTFDTGIDVLFEATAMMELEPAFSVVDGSFYEGRVVGHLSGLPETAYVISLTHDGSTGGLATASFNVR